MIAQIIFFLVELFEYTVEHLVLKLKLTLASTLLSYFKQ